MIKWSMKKLKFKRRTSTIIILVIVISIIIGLLIWGITSLASETTTLLTKLNEYIEKIYKYVHYKINEIDMSKIKIPNELKNILQDNTNNMINIFVNKLKEFLNRIPSMVIYITITIIALYFILTDKIYILDQLEHHLPEKWMKQIIKHTKDLFNTLGKYLEAEVTLIVISFIIVLIGLTLLNILKFNIEYPVLLALGIGFVDALPILGTGTVMIPWAIISALDGDIKLGVALIILYGIVAAIKQFLEPKIVSSNIGIHPLFTIIAMYTGFRFIGIIGMLVGPIILIILKNIFAETLDKGLIKSIVE